MSIKIKVKKKFSDFELQLSFQSSSKRIGILGASGCGKSMTLKMLAGIEEPDDGIICIDEKEIYHKKKRINWKPQKRKVGYLFQNYALFPHMTVKENIMVGMEGSKKEKEVEALSMMKRFHLSGLEDHVPSQLSGGQQQRVALARIMASKPSVILLDEPFSALDLFLKEKLQQELMDLLEEYEGTVILVSHSRDEIYRFSEELLIMEKGQIVCHGDTKEIFQNPRYKEAAKLTGCKNIVPYKQEANGLLWIEEWGVKLKVHQEVPKEGYIGIRAHDFIPSWQEEEGAIPVQIQSIAELPFETRYYIKTNRDPICWFIQRKEKEELEGKGLPLYLKIPEEKVMILE